MQVRIVMTRRLNILKGNYTAQVLSTWYVYFFELSLVRQLLMISVCLSIFVIQAVIIGTTFVRMTDATTGYFSRGGVLFLYVISIPLNIPPFPSHFSEKS